MKTIIEKLVKMANDLDQRGFRNEADMVDRVVRLAAGRYIGYKDVPYEPNFANKKEEAKARQQVREELEALFPVNIYPKDVPLDKIDEILSKNGFNGSVLGNFDQTLDYENEKLANWKAQVGPNSWLNIYHYRHRSTGNYEVAVTILP